MRGIGCCRLLVLVLLVWTSVTSSEKPKMCRNHPKQDDTCQLVVNDERVDCIPGYGVVPTQDECSRRNCCWAPIPNQNTTDAHRPLFSQSRYPMHLGVPSCYYPPNYASFYPNPKIENTNYGQFAEATISGQSPYPEDVTTVRMEAYFETANRLRVKIYDPSHSRYEVSVPQLPTPPDVKASDTNYGFKFHTDSLGFCVWRTSTNETIFNTSIAPFIFSNQYIQLSSRLASSNIYGLGDSNDRFSRSLDWQIIPLFGSLLFPDYGSHPFYLSMEKSQKSHGVFLYNSNGMDIFLQPAPAITYRVIGGILDFYFMLGDKPDDVIAEYTGLVGAMVMPPYWSLGFHLCRYNYNSSDITRDTWLNNVNAGIPFDVQWNDIDYMVNFEIFTYDTDRYGSLPALVDEIHNRSMRYVSITDSGIYSQPPGEYATFDDLLASNAYIKDLSGNPALGTVWPPISAFTDFSHPNATDFWEKQYARFYKSIKYDGAWIDMNEPTTFSVGTIDGGCPNTTLDYPPYVPAVEGGKLFAATICMSNQHYQNQTHYNLHNLYGITKTIATYNAMVKVLNKRPFVLSRATFPGHGAYGFHWSGDIYSAWTDMKQSITSILNFNIFGIPMIGADICGFRNNTNLELCQRWTELGAFYPFARNHNENTTRAQDPYSLGQDMISVAISALTLRYNLLPFFYTQFYRANAFGETVVRALFFEFPGDLNTYTIDNQFLWGRSLMVLPVLEKGVTTIKPYLPKAIWYLWPNRTAPINGTGAVYSAGIPAPIGRINTVIRGGSAIFTQGVSQTTDASRKNPYSLLVALDENGSASGDLFLDDGDSINTVGSGKYTYITLAMSEKGRLVSTVVHSDVESPTYSKLTLITIYGVSVEPTSVKVDDTAATFTYDAVNMILDIDGLQVDVTATFTVTWS